MKTLRVLLLMALALVAAGCSTAPDSGRVVQKILDQLLPPTFTGDIDTRYKIPAYLDIHIAAGGLYRTAAGWHFTWAEYHRNGPAFSSADIVIGKRP